jgi:hypothetical protein
LSAETQLHDPALRNTSRDLIPLIYETAMDNSLWPDLILGVYHEFEREQATVDGLTAEAEELQEHLMRGCPSSEFLEPMRA